MSSTAFKLDIGDQQTIRGFVERVQSPERLKLLLVLTVADIRAVGPKVWNGWKAALLRELYQRAIEVISGGLIEEGWGSRVATAQAAARRLLSDFSETEFATFVGRGYPFYWLSFDPDTHARHARLMREAEASGTPLTVEKRIDTQRAVTEVTVYAPDRLGLISDLAGAFALAGADIVDARIFTLNNGRALDSFTIQDAGGAFERPDKLARLAATIEHALAEAPDGAKELALPPAPWPSRFDLFTVAPRVLIDNRASAGHTVVEVNGRDRKGLLYRLTRVLAALKLQIASAKVSTFGARAVDVFYVKDQFGLKIEDERRLKAIRERLLAVLADPLAEIGLPAEVAAAG